MFLLMRQAKARYTSRAVVFVFALNTQQTVEKINSDTECSDSFEEALAG